MDTYKLKWTGLEAELFSLLCRKAGERLSQRDMAKMLKASPTGVANAVKTLLNQKLVIIEKTKTINFVSLNRDEPKAIGLKRVENLKSIILSQLVEYLETELAGATVILFGSYARGEDTNTSDIDLAVIERKDKLLQFEKYEGMLNRKINVNFYSSWKDIHNHLRNNILNGIVLQGSVAL